jgi:hypothetical protein
MPVGIVQLFFFLFRGEQLENKIGLSILFSADEQCDGR